jgi:hypothetical protein
MPAINTSGRRPSQIGWRPVFRLELERAGVGHLLRAGEIHEAEPNLISSERAILAYGETTGADANDGLERTLNLRGQRASSSGATRSCTSPSTSTSTRRRPPYNGGIELKRML